MVRRKNPLPKPFRPSEGSASDQHSQPQMQEQRQSMDENQPSTSDQVSTSQIQPEGNDDSARERTRERTQQSSLRVTEPCVEDGTIVNKSTSSSEHQSGDDAHGEVVSAPLLIQQSPEAANEPVGPACGLVPQNVEDACGPKVPTHGLIHQSGEDAYEPEETTDGLVENTTHPTHDLVHEVTDVDSVVDASQRYMDSIYVEQELDPELAQIVKPFPSDGLYLNSKDDGYGNSTPAPSSKQQSLAFNGPDTYLKAKGRPFLVSPASTRFCDPAKVKNGPVKLSSGGPKSRFHPYIRNRQHKKGRVSPNKQSPPAKVYAQMVKYPGDSHIPLTWQIPQVERNSTTTQPPQNLLQQTFVSENKSVSQAQMAQFPMQSVGQYGMVADNQFYNQMMENNFPQQQHIIAQHHCQEQQQFIQQQEVQQPYQLQQDHNLYSQQRHQLPRLSFQQLLQLQEQQAMQQQLLMDVHHDQQHQFCNQFLQLQEQNPMQYQQFHKQHHQQIISPQISMCSRSFSQQVVSPDSASASEFPSLWQQSQGITQLHHTAASGSAVSPHNQLQPSNGVMPLGAGASRPSSSPYNEQYHRT